MILWTPIHLEQVLEGLNEMTAPNYEQITYQGIPVLVEKTSQGQQRIVKLLSTNPSHYLSKETAPGSIINI